MSNRFNNRTGAAQTFPPVCRSKTAEQNAIVMTVGLRCVVRYSLSANFTTLNEYLDELRPIQRATLQEPFISPFMAVGQTLVSIQIEDPEIGWPIGGLVTTFNHNPPPLPTQKFFTCEFPAPRNQNDYDSGYQPLYDANIVQAGIIRLWIG